MGRGAGDPPAAAMPLWLRARVRGAGSRAGSGLRRVFSAALLCAGCGTQAVPSLSSPSPSSTISS